ncbi:TRAP transporter small permease [Hominifimenecus sp. rT4P-3]|uniref:TRAP transporter small permease n=1 Tax=Hominifimenecus sp. rT4P-3 TaxID=3242979 RepID=UPI003DA37481
MKVLKWLEQYLEEGICVILLISLTVVMMLQVVLRYFFQAPLVWPEEFCRYCFVASAFISLGYCFRTNCMLRVDMLVKRVPKVIGIGLEVFARVMSIAFCAIMIEPAFQVAKNAAEIHQASPAMKLPMWILYGIAPIGFVLGTARGIQDLVKYFLSLRKKEKGVELS